MSSDRHRDRRDRRDCGCCIRFQPIMPDDGPCSCRCKPRPPPCKLPIYFTGRLQTPLTLVGGANTTIPFNLVVALSPDGAYNGLTGIFTVPWDGSGFYSLTAHFSLTGGDTLANVTASIMVNGTPAIQDTEIVSPGQNLNIQLAIGFPLTQAASVMAVVLSDVSGVVVTISSTNFSLVKVA